MSISQLIQLCFTGSLEEPSMRHESIGGIGLQMSPKDKCEQAMIRLEKTVAESCQIQHETATASRLLGASSKELIECFACPERGFDVGRNMP